MYRKARRTNVDRKPQFECLEVRQVFAADSVSNPFWVDSVLRGIDMDHSDRTQVGTVLAPFTSLTDAQQSLEEEAVAYWLELLGKDTSAESIQRFYDIAHRNDAASIYMPPKPTPAAAIHQVPGVNESDKIVTSLSGIQYIASDQVVDIFDTNAGVMQKLSTIPIAGGQPRLHLIGQKLVVLSTSYTTPYQDSTYLFTQNTQVDVYDVSNGAKPRLVKSETIEGEYLDSRSTNQELILVANRTFTPPRPLFFPAIDSNGSVLNNKQVPLGRFESEAEYRARIRGTIVEEFLPDVRDSTTNTKIQDVGSWQDLMQLKDASSPNQSIVLRFGFQDGLNLLGSEVVNDMTTATIYVDQNNVFLFQQPSRPLVVPVNGTTETTRIVQLALENGGEVRAIAQGTVNGAVRSAEYVSYLQGELRIVTPVQLADTRDWRSSYHLAYVAVLGVEQRQFKTIFSREVPVLNNEDLKTLINGVVFTSDRVVISTWEGSGISTNSNKLQSIRLSGSNDPSTDQVLSTGGRIATWRVIEPGLLLSLETGPKMRAVLWDATNPANIKQIGELLLDGFSNDSIETIRSVVIDSAAHRIAIAANGASSTSRLYVLAYDKKASDGLRLLGRPSIGQGVENLSFFGDVLVTAGDHRADAFLINYLVDFPGPRVELPLGKSVSTSPVEIVSGTTRQITLLEADSGATLRSVVSSLPGASATIRSDNRTIDFVTPARQFVRENSYLTYTYLDQNGESRIGKKDIIITPRPSSPDRVLAVPGETVTIPITKNDYLDYLGYEVPQTSELGAEVSIAYEGNSQKAVIKYRLPLEKKGAATVDRITYSYNYRGVDFTENVAVNLVDAISESPSVSTAIIAVDSSGNPLHEVAQGQDFFIEVRTRDNRSQPLGVVSAYLDLLFNSDELTVLGPAQGIGNYNANVSGEVATNRISHLGAAVSNPDLASTNAIRIVRIPVRATKLGLHEVSGVLSAAATFETTLKGFDSPILTESLSIETLSLLVTPPKITIDMGAKSDVTNDGFVTPLDALVVINFLNAQVSSGSNSVSASSETSRLDVNADGNITPLDALYVINWLNQKGIVNVPSPGEGESVDGEELKPQNSFSRKKK